MSKKEDVSQLNLSEDDFVYYYVGVRASPYGSNCTVYGLTTEEIQALSKRFPNDPDDFNRAMVFQAAPFTIINVLAELGYRVVSSAGEREILWTLQREIGTPIKEE